MRKTVLAIDAGGTSSRAYLVDLEGRCLGHGRSRGGNPASNDPGLAASSIIAAARAAFDDARAGPMEIGTALMALAGPPGRVPLATIEPAFRALGLTGSIVMPGDLLAMFASATPAADGYCVVAGTGSGAVRIRSGAIDGVVDAAGWLVGDLGSGYWLGHEAAKAAVAALEGRGATTALTEAILDALKIARSEERTNGRSATLRGLIDAVYAMRPIELAQFAPLVIAHRADPVAARLIAEAERYLITDFSTVFDPAVPGPVALGGGVMQHLTGVASGVGEVIRAAGLEPDVRLVADGSVGAIVLALRASGIEVDEARFATIAASVEEHRRRRAG